MIRPSPLLNVMASAVRKAARGLARDFGEVAEIKVARKGPADFVSAADHRAEQILFDELSKARPGYGFLMEERGAIDGTDKTHQWIVDPLDGTLNFLHGIGHFAISVGLKRDGEIVAGIVARKKFVSLCTNALLLEKKLDLFTPSPFLFFSVHLDGLEEEHDRAVDQKGTFQIAVKAIKAAQEKGFQVNVNATIFNNMTAKQVADYLDYATELGVNVTFSPGYAYERAADQEAQH
ncbi:MAG TPA: hypothetical protein DCZ49_05055 [Hyphomonadaceae bacterium]|nr:hypothetical protein [Hyphomonadaceae bacterium]